MKRIFNYILLVCFFLWCVILFIRTLEKPIKQVLLNERNELLYRNDSDTLKQTNYFTNERREEITR